MNIQKIRKLKKYKEKERKKYKTKNQIKEDNDAE